MEYFPSALRSSTQISICDMLANHTAASGNGSDSYDSEDEILFLDAAYYGDVPLLKTAVAQGHHLSHHFVHEAVRGASVPALQWLLDQGVRVSKRTAALAVRQNNPAVLQLLEEAEPRAIANKLSPRVEKMAPAYELAAPAYGFTVLSPRPMHTPSVVMGQSLIVG